MSVVVRSREFVERKKKHHASHCVLYVLGSPDLHKLLQKQYCVGNSAWQSSQDQGPDVHA